MGASLVRVTSFVGKELRGVVRRPGLLLSLVIGPFLILFLFGLGYSGFRAPFATEIVIAPDSGLPRDPEYYADLAPGRIDVVRISDDADAGRARLVARKIDLLIVCPQNAAGELRSGRQTTIEFEWNQVDPSNNALAGAATSFLVSALNTEIIETAAAAGVDLAESELGPRAEDLAPEVIARPAKAESTNIAPSQPDVVNFFGPAVLALVIQHLAVTLTSLSLVRERMSGQLDRYRVAPVSPGELLVGKYLAFGVLAVGVAALMSAGLVVAFHVPLLDGPMPVAGIVVLLTFASLGLGLFISLVADSERQAVLLAMLVLLASVFFSGFVLPVADFARWMQPLAYVLPVTHGIATLQDSMLYGAVQSQWMLVVLGSLGVVLYLVSLLRVRHILRGMG